MCGINAVFDRQGRVQDKVARVQAMNRQMVYRGPDDEGLVDQGIAVLGIRRLSIIDVGGGHQPLFNEDGTLVVVCNGEIYNFVELRQELEGKGHRFRSKSDSEIILHLYEEMDTRCLERLRGMFAFVLWDHRKQRLFAARDRMGIKPLYFAERDGVLWLSSELKAIVAGAGLSPTLNPTAIWQFLHHGYPIDQRNTVVREVQRILPGEFVLADLGSTRRERYWKLCYGGMPRPAPTEASILETLTETVRIHLRSDVPMALLLSGGLDSSAIGALASRSGCSLAGICVGYADSFGFDERATAKRAASELHCEFQEIVLDFRQFQQEFESLTARCDEPIADPAAVPQWAVYRAARDLGIKVLLSGLGGDEVFFGYDGWNALGEKWGQTGQYSTDFLSTISPQFSDTRWLLDRLARPNFRTVRPGSNQPLEEFGDGLPPGPEKLYAMLFGSYLIHNCLLLTDKLSMGCSLELRVPLVDHVLIECVMLLPLRDRFSASQTKPLLRRLLKDVLPPWILNRPKAGFNVPGDYQRQLISDARDEILSGELAAAFLESEALTQILPKGSPERAAESRIVRAVKRRAFRALRAAGADELAFRFSSAQSTQFLYRVLVFEKWWRRITALSKQRAAS